MAEDDPDDYHIFSEFLHETDNTIKLNWFQTCEGLLDFLKTSTNLPDLIVLDMNMPKMDGHTCLVSIKKELHFFHIPVMILSTTNHETTVNRALQAGAIKYYQKPYSLDEYRRIIKEMLETPLH
jgi:CheY-like chemotaxis protein